MTVTIAKPVIPDHELICEIGSGSYGVVWLGRTVLGSFRAVKVVHRRSFPARRPYDREYAGLMRYEPLSRGHPGLVSVLHVGRNAARQYFYYTMELADDAVRGRKVDPDTYEPRTLRSDLMRLKRLPVADCLRITQMLCSALSYLHRNGVVHRDVKPSNIIFVDDQPKFADIGLVKNIDETSTDLGSDGYKSPEVPGKPTADLFSLGKVLYELVTGQHQLEFPTLPDDFDRWPDARERHRVLEIVRKACDEAPGKRFQTAEDMQAQLQRLMARPGTATAAPVARVKPMGPLKVVILGESGAGPAASVLQLLESELLAQHCTVFVDRATRASVEWARAIEAQITSADLILALLTSASPRSETIGYELELARSASAQNSGRPRILAVFIELTEEARGFFTEAAGGARGYEWIRSKSPTQCWSELQVMLRSPQDFHESVTPPQLEAEGGAVPLDSPYYLARPADDAFCSAVLARESIVLVKGARQMGKTSLLARGLQQARKQGHQVVLTDFQQLNAVSFESLEHFYFALGNSLADRLNLDAFPEDVWDSRRTPNSNLERYLKCEVLGQLTSHLVWGIDELDRLFPCPFSGEVFSLFRSWHNTRALDPATPWARLTLAMAFATEAHLFVTDLAQSPFNVGTRLQLDDFTPEQVGEMNRLYGSPIASDAQLDEFVQLVGGQPYLVRRGLHELVTRPLTFEAFKAQAEQDDGFFGDHLRRLLFLLAKDSLLVEAMRRVVQGEPCPTPEAFHRLLASGVIVGPSLTKARPRCQLYGNYLRNNL